MPIFPGPVPRATRKGYATCARTNGRPNQDLLVAASVSRSTRSLERLLQTEREARKMIMNRRDEELCKSLRNSMVHLVRWLDEPFTARLSESLNLEHVRETMNDLMGKRVRNRADLTCPVFGKEFAPADARKTGVSSAVAGGATGSSSPSTAVVGASPSGRTRTN